MRSDNETRFQDTCTCMESCYLCGATLPAIGFVVEATCFKRCRSCSVVMQSPLPRQVELTELYTPEYYETAETYAQSDDLASVEVQQRLQVERLAFLDVLKPARGRLLDIGCGLGDFLLAARDRGWSVCGIEASPHAARIAGEHAAVSIFVGTLDSLPLAPSSFAAVTFWDVVEHLVDPRDVLGRAYTLLEPGGILAVSMPNVDGIKARVLGRRWRYFRRRFGHVMHYSPTTLARLVQQAGFDVVSVHTHGFFNLSFVQSRLPAAVVARLPRVDLRAIQQLTDRAAGRLGIGENMELYARK